MGGGVGKRLVTSDRFSCAEWDLVHYTDTGLSRKHFEFAAGRRARAGSRREVGKGGG